METSPLDNRSPSQATKTGFTPRRFGKYLLLERIGRGGMAEVFRSKTFGAAGFVKECAIKKILASLLDDDQFIGMFIDEAKLTAYLTHPNIVQVLDLGELDGHLFIAMEYVAGKDLLDVLARSARRGVRIPVELALYIASELLKGLDFAHKAVDPHGRAMHIVHRDVSPSNILLSYDGQVKVGDFGIAKSQMQSATTEAGTQKGKTGYMSPEQVSGLVVDHRSDLFAASVILFEMLTMTRLFKASSDLDIMLKIRDADVADDLARAAQTSPELAEILRVGLARRPDDRYQTGAEFLEALRIYAQDHRIKLGAGSLEAFLSELFVDKIEAERERRSTDPVDDRGFEAVANANQALFRYRDGVGVIHGPMRPAMMQELLASRAPVAGEAISFDAGAWKPLSDFAEFGDIRRPAAAGERPPAPDESGLGRLGPDGADWEDLSLAGINPRARRRLRTRAAATVASPPPVRHETGASRDPTVAATREVAALESTDRAAQRARRASVSTSVDAAAGAAIPGRRSRRRSQSITAPAPPDVIDSVAAEAVRTGPQPTARGRAAGDAQETPSASAAVPGVPLDAESGAIPARSSSASGETTATRRGQFTANYDVIEPPHTQSEVEAIRARTVAAAGAPALSGELGEVSVFRLVHRLGRELADGRLRVESNGIAKDMYFRQGELLAVDSNDPADRLLDLLVARGAITAAAQKAAESQTAAATEGEALVAAGALASHELYHYLQVQLAEKLTSALFWDTGRWAWWRGSELEPDPFPVRVDLSDTLVTGVGERAEVRYFRRFYRRRRDISLEQRLDGDALRSLRLSSRAMRLVSSIAQTDTVDETVRVYSDRYRWPEGDVYRTLYLLTEFEVLRFDGEESAATLPPGGA